MYEGALIMGQLGVTHGLDMTRECALAKLSYLLGKNYPLDEVKRLMMKNLRGELSSNAELTSFTVASPNFLIQVSDLSAEHFPLTTSKGQLMPTLMNEAAALVSDVVTFVGTEGDVRGLGETKI